MVQFMPSGLCYSGVTAAITILIDQFYRPWEVLELHKPGMVSGSQAQILG